MSEPVHSPRSIAPAKPSRPFFLRRGPMEAVAVTLIGLGFLMLFQPFLLVLYTYSLVTLLAGTFMFMIVSKFPE